MTHYAVIGRIPFDDEDTAYFFNDVAEDTLHDLFAKQIYEDSGRDDQDDVYKEHGTPVFITYIIKTESEMTFI